MKLVQFNNEEIPVHYGVAGHAEVMTLLGFDLVKNGFVEIKLTLEALHKIAYIGMKHGARKSGKQFPESYYEWCDLIEQYDNYEELLAKCSEVYSEERGDPGNHKSPAKRAKK